MKRWIALAAATVGVLASSAAAMQLSAWTTAVSVESVPGASAALNSSALVGCPFVAQRDDVL